MHFCLIWVRKPASDDQGGLGNGYQGGQRRSNQSILKSVLNIHWKDWCWSCNSNTLATSCEELTHWKRPWCWESLKAGEGDDRGWDGWVASATRWTGVWVNSGNWWWTRRPGVLQSMGLQRARHNWVTEPNWIEPRQSVSYGDDLISGLHFCGLAARPCTCDLRAGLNSFFSLMSCFVSCKPFRSRAVCVPMSSFYACAQIFLL